MPNLITKISENRQIVIANQINESRFKMSRAEQKLILYCIAMVDNKNDKLGLTFEMSIQDFVDFLEIKGNDYYQRILDITEDFAGRVFEIKQPNGEIHRIPALSIIKYKKGSIELKVNPELAPYLLDLKSRFTKYSLQEALSFKSGFSMRIYQLLSQYQYKQEVEYTVEQLRFCLNIDDNKFGRFNDFKRFVLDYAQKEIAEKSSLKFEYKLTRKNQKVVAIKFIITQAIKPDASLLKSIGDQPNILEDIQEELEVEQKEIFTPKPQPPQLPQTLKTALVEAFNFSDDQIDQLALKHTPEALKNALDVVLYNQQETLTKVKKPKNLFYDCLKNPDKYDLFPVEDKRKQEQKEEEERQAEERQLKLEEEQQEQEGEKTKIKQQAIDFYIDLNPEEYKQILKEVVAEMKADKTQSFIFTQLQRLAQKEKISIEEALERSLFTKHLGREKLWREKLEGNVMF